jgi:hypothetical protein
VELESSESLSLLGAGGLGGLLVATGAVTGAVAEMLDTLMGTGILTLIPDCGEREPMRGEFNR